MCTLRKTNDVRVSAKFLDALRRHIYAVLKETCAADGNEKRITKFHVKIKKNAGPGGLVRESAVREAVVEIRGGPTQMSKGVFLQIDAYAAAVCRASVDAAGNAMTVSHLMIPPDSGRLAVLNRGGKRSPNTGQKSDTVNYRERRHISAKYAVTLQGATLQGTIPYVTAYGDAKLKKAITRDVRRFFDHLGLHGSIEVDVYAIEVRG
jgi:hypothetical protein